MGYYKGQNGPEVIKEAESDTNGFKKGGRAKHAKGGKAEKKMAPMMGADAKHHAGRKPRKSGGAVFSTAAKSEPRKK